MIAIGAYGKQEVWLTSKAPKGEKAGVLPKRQFGTLRGKFRIGQDAFSEELDAEIAGSIEPLEDVVSTGNKPR